MPSQLIIENGTGVSGANSFVTLAEILDYLTRRNSHTVWASKTEAEQDAAAIKAADWLKNEAVLNYRGTANTYTQGLPWPRTGATYRNGPEIPTDVIPPCLKYAQCELASRAISTDILPDLDRGGMITERKVDVIQVKYADGAPAGKLIRVVMGILQPVLRTGSIAETAEPYYAVPETTTPFEDGEYSYE